MTREATFKQMVVVREEKQDNNENALLFKCFEVAELVLNFSVINFNEITHQMRALDMNVNDCNTQPKPTHYCK